MNQYNIMSSLRKSMLAQALDKDTRETHLALVINVIIPWAQELKEEMELDLKEYTLLKKEDFFEHTLFFNADKIQEEYSTTEIINFLNLKAEDLIKEITNEANIPIKIAYDKTGLISLKINLGWPYIKR